MLPLVVHQNGREELGFSRWSYTLRPTPLGCPRPLHPLQKLSRSGTHAPTDRPGIGLSPGIMPARPVTTPTTSATVDLAPWLARGARARAQYFDRMSLGITALAMATSSHTRHTHHHMVSVRVCWASVSMHAKRPGVPRHYESHNLVDAHSRRRRGIRCTCRVRARPWRQRRWA